MFQVSSSRFHKVISKEEVQKIAKLARLELTEKEIEKMQKDLSAILDYFNVLKRTPKVKERQATRDKRQVKNELRKDEVLERPVSLANNLIATAASKKDEYIKVKQVF